MGSKKAPTVAVVLHTKKVRGADRDAVREALAAGGVRDPLWYEVPKSRKARKRVKKARKKGADVVVAWGGDGTVQRCVDALAGHDVALAIIPGGTSNLLATALGIPDKPADAVRLALEGRRQKLDTGTANGEHFAVVAGAGIDALVVEATDSDLKERLGRAAYVLKGAGALDMEPFEVDVDVDGERVFRGRATSVLVGNAREAVGGLSLSDEAQPDDGVMEVGVITAEGPLQLVRTAARALLHRAESSPHVTTSDGTSVVLQFGRPVPYELDGGEREPTRILEIEVHPKSLTVCVPADG